MPKPGSTTRELELHIEPEFGVPFRVVEHTACDDDSDCPDMLRGRTFDDLKKVHFPVTNLSKNALLWPIPHPDDGHPTGVPGLLVQANIIEGGLIVGISWHHTLCDACGMSIFLRAWAKATEMACEYGVAEPEDAPEVSDKWMLSYGTEGATIEDFPNHVFDTGERFPDNGRPHLLDCSFTGAPGTKISMWYFNGESLKKLVNLLATAESTQRYTQTEALSALLWKCLSQARQLHLTLPEGTSLFTTRIDYRRRMSPPLPRTYVGNANQPVPCTRVPIQEVCAPSSADSIRALASHIRGAVAKYDDKIVRKFIRYVETLPGTTDLVLDFDTFPGPDIAITDVSGLDTMHHNWGSCLGRCYCVRGFMRYKGFASFFPQDAEGGIPLYMQCETETLERMKVDPVFTEYGEFLY